MIWEARDNTENIIQKKISIGEYSIRLSQQKYKRHSEGTKEFIEYSKSQESIGMSRPAKLYLSYEEAQQVILQYAATGDIKFDRNGNILPQEFIRTDKIIGAYEEHDVYINTKSAMIKYGKYNAHLIPVKEKI